MKLNDMMDKTLREVLNECDILEHKVHTNDTGEVMAIEAKYKPKDAKPDKEIDIPGWR